MSQERILRLLDELDRQRAEFVAALGALPPGAEEREVLEKWEGPEHYAEHAEHLRGAAGP